MLQLSGTIDGRRVLSLRTSTTIAIVQTAIINPDNLKIVGFYCRDSGSKNVSILLFLNIREMLPQGFVVDDYDALSDPSELVRHKELLDKNFELLGKPVETISHDKIGKVQDFAYETTSMYIQKLYVSQSILKNLTSGNLSVDRNQIQEVTPKKVIIQDLLQATPVVATASIA